MTDLMNRECSSLYSDWISQSRHDQRSLFRKALTAQLHQQQALPPHADKAALSQELANFFVIKVNNIHSTIDSNTSASVTPSDNSNIESQHTFHQFKELSEEEIVFAPSA